MLKYVTLVAAFVALSTANPFVFQKKFFVPPKPVDCQVVFTDWTACSLPCGPGGVQRRWAQILVNPKNGGKPCPPLEQERPCLDQPECTPPPVDCEVQYGPWSECTKNCGGGFQWRRGTVIRPAQNGGKECPPLEQEQACNQFECTEPPVDCQVWFGEWTACSTSCGEGVQLRRGVIEVEPKNGGKECPPLEQTRPCNQDLFCTPVVQNCEIQFNSWSECSKPCGGGFQWRRAVIVKEPLNGGRLCPPLEEERACNNHACTTTPIDCVVSYSDWTECSAPCGGGVRRRWGTILVQPQNGGAPCNILEQEEACNEHLCDRRVVDCQVEYSAWSECSLPCGGGQQQRWGRILVQPENGGKPCPALEQSRSCNQQPCLTVADCKIQFNEWSQCSTSCGGGFQWRRAVVLVEPMNGGKQCPPLEEERACNQFECDEPNVDCQVWYADWSECSQPCGGGFQWRRGVIEVEPKGAGKPCPPLEQERACNNPECDPRPPVDCLVKYSDWTVCSAPCNGGIRRRWGTVLQQAANGGKPCPPLEQEETCNEHLCDPVRIDCKVQWTPFSECSASCDGGVSRRWGTIIQQPTNGGAPCPPLEEERSCNTDINCIPTIVDCKVKYTDWTECSKPCGGGIRQRWGTILQRGTDGGQPCPPLEQQEPCNIFQCVPPPKIFKPQPPKFGKVFPRPQLFTPPVSKPLPLPKPQPFPVTFNRLPVITTRNQGGKKDLVLG